MAKHLAGQLKGERHVEQHYLVRQLDQVTRARQPRSGAT
jgi:hypothetical protein